MKKLFNIDHNAMLAAILIGSTVVTQALLPKYAEQRSSSERTVKRVTSNVAKRLISRGLDPSIAFEKAESLCISTETEANTTQR